MLRVGRYMDTTLHIRQCCVFICTTFNRDICIYTYVTKAPELWTKLYNNSPVGLGAQAPELWTKLYNNSAIGLVFCWLFGRSSSSTWSDSVFRMRRFKSTIVGVVRLVS